jgi:RHS repeat-associated protein
LARRLAWATVLCIGFSSILRGQNGPDNDPDGLRGYVDNVFHHGQVDSVNLYNGLLTVPIAVGPSYPIGPKLKFQVMLAYSSRLSEWGHPSGGNSSYPYFPYSGDPALGLGWTFTLGAIKNSGGVYYIGSDGSQHIFDAPVSGYPTYLKTSDGAQLMLHDMGSGGPYEMWDADGNHYLFDVPGHVTGNDDSPTNFTHDFGRGRDGWYLTSLTDPFGNGLTVTYRANVSPVPCAGTYSVVCSNVQMQCLNHGNTWIPQTINLPTGAITVGLDGNSHVSTFTFPVVVSGSATTATWTLGYNQPGPGSEGSSRQTCDDFTSYDFHPWVLKSIQLPGNIGSYQFTYGKVSNCNSNLLSQIQLPTGATVEYLYGMYSFYHGRLASLTQNCTPIGPDPTAVVLESSAPICFGPEAPIGPKFSGGNCEPTQQDRYLDQQLGVAQRTETVGGDVNVTKYVQFAFPFGENGYSPTHNCDGVSPPRCGPQSLTVVVFPTEKDGKRRAKGTLFWSGPKNGATATYAGDRTGADIEERVYDSDDDWTQNVSIGAMPVCGGGVDNPFCANHAVRVTQRTYEYDIASSEVANRRLLSEIAYHQTPAVNDTCAGCKNHQVSYSNNSPHTWESNGRHYDVETHSGNLVNDSRTITTTWTPSNWTIPNGQTVLPNLYNHRVETDSLTTVDRSFEFNGSNGFLNCSFLWDSDPTRKRAFFNRRYPNGDGTLNQDFTATAGPLPSQPPIGQCVTSYPANAPPYPGGAGAPTVIGTNGDAFGRLYTYQNGLLTSARWIVGNSLASWYAKNYTRDSGTAWITASSDTASKTTGYQYDSIGRVTLIAPPDGEASTVVGYPSTTRTTATRNGGTGLSTYQQYEYDGLGRLSKDIHQMPGLNKYAVRTHAYDGPGRQYFDSEWKDCTGATGDCLTAAPGGTISSSFDPFGRAQTVTRADGSTTNISFADSYSTYSDTKKTVTVNNLGGVCSGGGCTGGSASQTTYVLDAFGRTTSVTEPGGDLTSYTYDVNGKLAGVAQGGQARAFTYDPAGFLRSESTPEKGTVNYTDYGSLGNLRREEPNGVIRKTCYDFAGRVTEIRTSEDGPTPLCAYENLNVPVGRLYLTNVYNDSTAGNSFGKLTNRTAWNYPSVGTYSVTDTYAYNGLGGRLSSLATAVTGGSSLSTTQTWLYNGLGLPAHHYHARSSGQAPFVVSYDYDAGLPVKEYANGIPVVTGVGYQASGALSGYVTGMNVGHNVTATINPDTSLLPRPLSILTSGATVNFASGTYSYDGAGNIMAIGGDQFGYDSRSRLTSAVLFGSGSQNFAYDQFGNLLSKIGTPGNTTFCTGSCTNNRLPGNIATYDGRGNMTANLIAPGGAENYTLDGLDRLITHQGPTLTWDYLYDGESERTAKVLRTGAWTYTFRDEGKRVSSEFGGSNPSRDNVFLGNLLTVSYASIPGSDRVWTFYTSDHLGTPRLVTDLAGTTVESPKNWPYGENVTAPGAFQRIRFASMERDTEASRYHDHDRSHEFNLARFLSVDRLQGRILDPQSWNRYSYALGNPLRYVDPDGMTSVDDDPNWLGKFFTDSYQKLLSNWFPPHETPQNDLNAEALNDPSVGNTPDQTERMVNPAGAAQRGLIQGSANLLGKTSEVAVTAALAAGIGKITEEVLTAAGGISANTFRKLSAHLPEFQKLDSEFGMKELVSLGRQIIDNPANKVGTRTFEQAATIGGKTVTVRAARFTYANDLKTAYIVRSP